MCSVFSPAESENVCKILIYSHGMNKRNMRENEFSKVKLSENPRNYGEGEYLGSTKSTLVVNTKQSQILFIVNHKAERLEKSNNAQLRSSRRREEHNKLVYRSLCVKNQNRIHLIFLMASNDYYETTSCSSEYMKLIQSLEFAFLMKHYKQEYQNEKSTKKPVF